MAYDVWPFADVVHRGGLSLIQTTAAQVTLASQVNIPIISANSPNPRNVSYQPQSNASAGIVNAVLGRRTPGFSFTALAKPGWFNAAFLNDILGGTDGYLDVTNFYTTSEYASNLAQPVVYPSYGQGNRVTVGLKCVGVEMVHTAGSGVICTFSWLPLSHYTHDLYYHTLYGDQDPSAVFSPPSFSSFTRQAGLDYGPADVAYGIAVISGGALSSFTVKSNAADQIDGFTLSLVRGQAQQQYESGDGKLWPAAVTTGMIGGSLRLMQGATYTNPPTNFAVRIGPAGGSGVVIVPTMSLDNIDTPWGQGRSVSTSDQSFVDLTGSVFAGYPFKVFVSP